MAQLSDRMDPSQPAAVKAAAARELARRLWEVDYRRTEHEVRRTKVACTCPA